MTAIDPVHIANARMAKSLYLESQSRQEAAADWLFAIRGLSESKLTPNGRVIPRVDPFLRRSFDVVTSIQILSEQSDALHIPFL